jgi:hypothetical protein
MLLCWPLRSGKYEVKGFPTLLGFGADQKEKPETYGGARDASGIVSFIKERLGGAVQD